MVLGDTWREKMVKGDTKDDCWVLGDGGVLDAIKVCSNYWEATSSDLVSQFFPNHPGGETSSLCQPYATEEIGILDDPKVISQRVPKAAICLSKKWIDTAVGLVAVCVSTI